MRQGKSGGESVANAKKLCYLLLPLANVQTLRIRDADPDPYFLDDKVEYVFLDKPIKTKVLAAQSNQLKLPQGLSKELIKQISCRHIKKKNDYAVPKNVRFSK